MEIHSLNEKVQFYKIHYSLLFTSSLGILIPLPCTDISGICFRLLKKYIYIYILIVQQKAAKAKEMKNLKSILLLS